MSFLPQSMYVAFLWLLAAGALGKSVSPEPPLDCSCQMSGDMKFSAAHAKDKSGKWNTQIAVSRGDCNSTAIHTEIVDVPFPDDEKQDRVRVLRLKDLGYERYTGFGEYKLYVYGETWDGARRRCAADGTHLAIPNSDGEAAILQQLLKRHTTLPGTSSNDLAWLGLHDISNEGFFLTIFGEPVKSTGWNQWNPVADNAGVSNTHPGEDCATLNKNTGKMTDFNCENLLAFFCEKEEGQYPPSNSSDYSAGRYIGVEQEKKPFVGKVRRRRPAAGYELFPGVGYYKYHFLTATWDEARRICRAEGGHLAIINSAEEHQVLLWLFKRNLRFMRNYNSNWYIHLGFHDKITEGQYLTIFGEPLTSTGFYTWAPNEPSDNGVTVPGEDCGQLYLNGGLADGWCIWLLAYVCEQELYL